jgi:hypothetical protein
MTDCCEVFLQKETAELNPRKGLLVPWTNLGVG